jgi:hypothetical protein
MEGGCRPESIEPPHIGGGWEGVDVSFSSFLCAKEKDRKGQNFLLFHFFFYRKIASYLSLY